MENEIVSLYGWKIGQSVYLDEKQNSMFIWIKIGDNELYEWKTNTC